MSSADQGFSLRLGSCGNYLMREAELKKEREVKDAKILKLPLKKQWISSMILYRIQISIIHI